MRTIQEAADLLHDGGGVEFSEWRVVARLIFEVGGDLSQRSRGCRSHTLAGFCVFGECDQAFYENALGVEFRKQEE